MGVVYRAHDTLLERVVALKIIATSIEDNPELRERFFREARAAGQLSHRNIITIHDLGEHEGQPYLAMEFLTGEDLQHRLARQEPMSLRRKLEIAAETCDGLSFAHRRGLVHRDVKPANIFITDDGVVKLLDFGLARMVASELTRSNTMLGTVNYMAPEQVRGERTDHRADIFSFGVVLYEMLSGRKAFQGDSFATTMYRILQDVPEPLLNIDATLPHEVVWLVEKALAKPRDERYQDLVDLGRDLAIIRQHLSGGEFVTGAGSALAGHRVPSDPPRSSGQTTIAAAPAGTRVPSDPLAASTPPVPPVHRSRTPLVAAAVLIGALGLAGIWYATRDEPVDDPAPRETAAAPAPVPGPAEPTASPQPAPQPATPDVPAAPVSAAEALRAERRAADEGRLQMTRAKAAARNAGSASIRSPAYAAAAAAEREGTRLYQAKRLPAAASKFFEASTLYRSAELTTAAAQFPAPPGRTDLPPPPQTAPAPAPGAQAAPPSAPPAHNPTPSVPPAETPVQLPPAPAPGVPPAPTVSAPPPANKTPVITAAEGTSSVVASQEAIRDLLRRYEQAVESRNLDALKRIWPGLQEEALRREFGQARRIDVDLDEPEITVSGGSGTVMFVRRYRVQTTDGQRLDTTSRTTMTVRRTGTEWHIDRVRFEALR